MYTLTLLYVPLLLQGLPLSIADNLFYVLSHKWNIFLNQKTDVAGTKAESLSPFDQTHPCPEWAIWQQAASTTKWYIKHTQRLFTRLVLQELHGNSLRRKVGAVNIGTAQAGHQRRELLVLFQ